MRTALMSILIFLWTIWIVVEEINYGEGFFMSEDWDRVGTIGGVLIFITGIVLFFDWIKKYDKKKSSK